MGRLGIDVRALRATTALVVVVACGSPYAATDPPGPDGGGADASGADGGADGMPPASDGDIPDGEAPTGCNPASKFGTPVRIEGAISGADEDTDGRVSDDELTLAFASDRGTTPAKTRIHTAVRTSTATPWAATKMVLERGDNVSDPHLSPSALRLVFQRGGKNTAARIVLAKRDTANDPFSDNNIPLPGGADQDERDPFVVFGATDADPSTLLYSQNGVTAARDLFTASLDGKASVTSSAPMTELNGPSNERDPVLSRDGVEIFFSSDRAQAGVMRIYHATRVPPAGTPFTNIEMVAELTAAPATNAFDSPSWISANRCVLYFSSDRGGTTDVWRAVRSP